MCQRCLENGRQYNALNWVENGQLLLKLPRIARYLVSDGSRIVVEQEEAADDRSLAVFSTVSPIAAILHQRSHICLHASGVSTPRGTFLFVAPSGTGKSTLAAALASRGYEVVTDDIAAIGNDGQNWSVASGPSRMKLWPDSLESLRIDGSSLPLVRNGLEKRILKLNGTRSESYPVAAICLLSEHNQEDTQVQRMSLPHAIEALMFNTYRRRMQAAVDHERKNFLRLAQLASAIPCFSVERPQTGFALSQLADEVESLVTKV